MDVNRKGNKDHKTKRRPRSSGSQRASQPSPRPGIGQGVLPRKRQRRMRAKSQQASPSPRRKAQEGAEEEDQWHLGLNSRAYRRTGANERLGELLQASRDFRQPPEIVDSTTFLEMVSWAEEFDQFLGRHSRTWAGQVGYVHDCLRRKLVVGQLSCSSDRTNVQWSDVSVDWS